MLCLLYCHLHLSSNRLGENQPNWLYLRRSFHFIWLSILYIYRLQKSEENSCQNFIFFWLFFGIEAFAEKRLRASVVKKLTITCLSSHNLVDKREVRNERETGKLLAVSSYVRGGKSDHARQKTPRSNRWYQFSEMIHRFKNTK